MVKMSSGRIVLFIMEPAEELTALRFIKTHKSPWPKYRVDVIQASNEFAKKLGLQGGYDPAITGLLWEYSVGDLPKGGLRK